MASEEKRLLQNLNFVGIFSKIIFILKDHILVKSYLFITEKQINKSNIVLEGNIEESGLGFCLQCYH